MTSTLHDPAAWPLSSAARDACATITAHLTGWGWRPLSSIYTSELVAAYGDPTALARVELRPDPAAEGQATVRLVRLSYPTVEAARPEPQWQLLATGPALDPEVLVRAAHTAPVHHAVGDDPLAVAARRHGWQQPPGDAADTQYTRAVSPDGRTTLTYGPYDALFTGHSAAEPWHAARVDERAENAWALTASQRMPAHVLTAALLEPRPVAELEPGPQHRLHQLLTGHGFTAYPWRQIELGGSGTPHLADVYLHQTPGGALAAVTAATTSVHRDPEIEVACFDGGADLDDVCCDRARRNAPGGHAHFTRRVPPQAVLAYLSTLTAPPELPPLVLPPQLLDACAAEIRSDQRAHPAWARAAAGVYAALTSYRPDQRSLNDPDSVEMIAGDLVTDLLHLADTTGVPGPHHALLEDAYNSYLAAGDDPDPAAPLPAADPYDATRTTAHP